MVGTNCSAILLLALLAGLPSCTFLFGPLQSDDAAASRVIAEERNVETQQHRYQLTLESDARVLNGSVFVRGTIAGERKFLQGALYTVIEETSKRRVTLFDAMTGSDSFSESHYVDDPLGLSQRTQSAEFPLDQVVAQWEAQGNTRLPTDETWRKVLPSELPNLHLQWTLQAGPESRQGRSDAQLGRSRSDGNFTIKLDPGIAEWATQQPYHLLTLQVELIGGNVRQETSIPKGVFDP